MALRIDNQLDEEMEILIRNIIGAAIDVHRELGPGYLEKVYERAMALELNHRGLIYATQVPVVVHYKGEKIHGQVLDMVVEENVILELKSVEMLLPIHEAQILSYLKSTCMPAGLLINFKERFVKNGIKRFIQSKQIDNFRVFFASFAIFAVNLFFFSAILSFLPTPCHDSSNALL